MENFKKINDKLLEKITSLEKAFAYSYNNKSNSGKLENTKNYITASKEEMEEEINNYKFQNTNLREIILHRDEALQLLSKENANFRNEIDKLLKLSDYDTSSVNSYGQKSRISGEINIMEDKEKIEKYKETVKNLKQDNKVLINQVNLI